MLREHARQAIVKGIKKAITPCPKCGGELRNRGYYWECKKCGHREGRKWVSDPYRRWVF